MVKGADGKSYPASRQKSGVPNGTPDDADAGVLPDGIYGPNDFDSSVLPPVPDHPPMFGAGCRAIDIVSEHLKHFFGFLQRLRDEFDAAEMFASADFADTSWEEHAELIAQITSAFDQFRDWCDEVQLYAASNGLLREETGEMASTL